MTATLRAPVRAVAPTDAACVPSRPRHRRSRRVVVAVSLCLTGALLSGCWSFTRSGMVRVNGGLQSADVIIFRHATRALIPVYDVTRGTDRQKTAQVAKVLRTAAGSLSGFARDRWNGATGSDQYREMSSELRSTRTRSRCLAVKIDAGWGTFGYDWHTHAMGSDGCIWGRNPLP